MVISQGDVFWIEWRSPQASEPAGRRPVVVIQNDLMNATRIATSIVCAITSNVRRADDPGNVLLEANEGGLPKVSVVNVSQVQTVDKSDLYERIGTLSASRVNDILRSLATFVAPRGLDWTEIEA